jgi:hypothetical protein
MEDRKEVGECVFVLSYDDKVLFFLFCFVFLGFVLDAEMFCLFDEKAEESIKQVINEVKGFRVLLVLERMLRLKTLKTDMWMLMFIQFRVAKNPNNFRHFFFLSFIFLRFPCKQTVHETFCLV